MFTKTDYEKLQMIMDESPEKKELISRLLHSHQMTVSTISHEIRNPLTLVYSTLQLIEDRYPNVLEIEYWSDLLSDVEYMKLLLEELSAYNNSNRLNLSEMNPNTFFKTLALQFASSLIDTDIQFSSRIAPHLPSIQGDTIKLREVFLNLLSNARDAVLSSHHSHKEKPCISFSVHSQADCLCIQIQDNGCGILPEHARSVFDPFVTYKKNGTGLGLPIAERIITAHGGTIQFTSSVELGTTFTLTLPVKQNS